MDDFFTLNVKPYTYNQFINEVSSAIRSSQKRFVVFLNATKLQLISKEKEYYSCVKNADFILGENSVYIGAKFLGGDLPEPILGVKTFYKLLDFSDENTCSLYFLGSDDITLSKVLAKISNEYKHIKVVGLHNGFFKEIENNGVIHEIINAMPDIVFVAMGSPKQELWISRNLDRFKKGVFIGIGGSLDVFTGNKKDAPEVIRRTSLEWFFRALQDPKIYFPRYISAFPWYILELLKYRLRIKN